MEKIINKVFDFPKPNRFFHIGDKVNYIDFKIKNGVVTDVLADGKVYEFKCDVEVRNKDKTKTYKKEIRYAPWFELALETNTPSIRNEGIKSFNHKFKSLSQDINNLINYHYSRGINYNADYQRKLVWEFEDKEALIDSIFKQYDIGSFALINLSEESKHRMEVIDGKQRLSTIIEFFEDKFTYKNNFLVNSIGKIEISFVISQSQF